MSENNPFTGWRSDKLPSFEFDPLHVDIPISATKDEAELLKKSALSQYYRASLLLEHSVAEVALQYVHKDGDPNNPESGPLLEFSKKFSNRYLDLLEAFVDMEADNGIPLIPVDAGQLKASGFTSKQIMDMQDSCKEFITISDEILSECSGDIILFNKTIEILTNKDSRDKYLIDNKPKEDSEMPKEAGELPKNAIDKPKENIDKPKKTINVSQIIAWIERYKSLKAFKSIDLAHNILHNRNRLSYFDVGIQLFQIANMQPKPEAKHDERLLMEIRHRFAGAGTGVQRGLGAIGTNPLAYLNVIRKGEKDNLEAEFRERMYFVYVASYFANHVVEDDKNITYINNWLTKHNKGWKLDPDFVKALKSRGSQDSPPIFRYGANAALSRALRTTKTPEETEKFNIENPNPTIRQVMNGLADINSYFNLSLSERELMNQMGEWTWDPKDKNIGKKPLNFSSGASIFNLIKDLSKIVNNEKAREYLEKVNILQIPVVAGISGTLDLSTAMAGLVDIGVSGDEIKNRQELETIRLAYLAFMLPGRDHSIHEIMQSSKTFGLEYRAGKNSVNYIYPEGGEDFLNKLKLAQKARGVDMPADYLSEEYTEAQLQKLRSSQDTSPTNEGPESQELISTQEPSSVSKTFVLSPAALKIVTQNVTQKENASQTRPEISPDTTPGKTKPKSKQ